MRTQNLVLATLVSVASVAGFSGAAFAGGTGVTNEYVNGTRRVNTNVQVENKRVEVGTFENFSNSSKIETNYPNAAGYAQITGRHTVNRINVSTNGPDPFVATSYSETIEAGTFKDVTSTKVNETSVGTDRIYRHTVSSQF